MAAAYASINTRFRLTAITKSLKVCLNQPPHIRNTNLTAPRDDERLVPRPNMLRKRWGQIWLQ
jgi:hypothetical protein